MRVMCVYLIAGSAAWLQPLGVVPAAVDLSILVEINEVHQQLVAHAAHEARRVPTHTVTCPGCEHSDVSTVYLAATLNAKRNETTLNDRWVYLSQFTSFLLYESNVSTVWFLI